SVTHHRPGRVRRAHTDAVADERVDRDGVVAASRIAVLGGAPVTRLYFVRPEIDRRRVAVECVVRDRVVLPLLDHDAGAVSGEVIVEDARVEAVPSPQSVIRSLD